MDMGRLKQLNNEVKAHKADLINKIVSLVQLQDEIVSASSFKEWEYDIQRCLRSSIGDVNDSLKEYQDNINHVCDNDDEGECSKCWPMANELVYGLKSTVASLGFLSLSLMTQQERVRHGLSIRDLCVEGVS